MVRDEYNHSRPVSALIRDWLLYNKAGGGGGIMKTVTGNPISVSDALAAPIQSLSVSLSPIQAGSGDPSPDNIRPITGRTEVTVARTGVNLFDGEVVNGRYSSGEFVESGSYRCSKNPMPCYPGMSVYFRDKSNAALALYVTLFTAAGEFISTTSVSAGNWTIPAGSGARWFKVHTTASVYTAATPICIALNAPSAYAPYDGQSVTVQLGQTVYGGTVDVTGGSAESEMAAVDMGDLTWGVYSGAFYANIPGMTTANAKATELICSMYKNVGSITATVVAAMAENTFGKRATYAQIFVKDSSVSTAADFKAKVTGQTLVYPLAEPTPLTFTPASLSTLRGDNTVWSDGDDISMTYKAASS